MLEVAWRFRLRKTPAAEAATTCLLYAEDDQGRALMAQLGDGLIARRSLDGTITMHPSHPEEFGFTQALGTPHTLDDWSLGMVAPMQAGEAVLLATDGVSGDLVDDRIGDLMDWLIEEIGSEPDANRRLRSELHNWPVPHHQDDKTLLVMWKT